MSDMPNNHTTTHRGKGKGSGSGREFIKLSKSLSYFLRHSNADFIGDDGFALVDYLLAAINTPNKRNQHTHAPIWSLEDVIHVVEMNDKQRFSMERRDDKWYIRANQGHSMKGIEVEMSRVTLRPDTGDSWSKQDLIGLHGTNLNAWELIRETGLKPMGRQHVHLAKGMPGESGVVSGMRKGCEIVIHVDLGKLLESGADVFESANGVLLCGEIDPAFFSRAVKVKWRGNEWKIVEELL